ncbi:MAG: hypothetical protein SGPRY_008121, partial [Prymnesium sp.]
EDFPAMPVRHAANCAARRTAGEKSKDGRKAAHRTDSGAREKKGGTTNMWAQIVKQGAKSEAEAATPGALSAHGGGVSKHGERATPRSLQSATRGLSHVLLETPHQPAAGLHNIKQPDSCPPKRVLTAADILRSGGVPHRSHGAGKPASGWPKPAFTRSPPCHPSPPHLIPSPPTQRASQGPRNHSHPRAQSRAQRAEEQKPLHSNPHSGPPSQPHRDAREEPHGRAAVEQCDIDPALREGEMGDGGPALQLNAKSFSLASPQMDLQGGEEKPPLPLLKMDLQGGEKPHAPSLPSIVESRRECVLQPEEDEQQMQSASTLHPASQMQSRQPFAASKAARFASSPGKRGGERLSPPRGDEVAHDVAANPRRTSKKQATGGLRRQLQMPPALPPCHFSESAKIALPCAASLAPLDRALARFVQHTIHEVRQADAPACELMERVQAEANWLWPGALVSCFGSRASGLACASSDVDLVVMGVPGLAEAHAAGCDMMGAQMALLGQLAERLEALPSLRSLSINKGSVPVIALSIGLPGHDQGEELRLDVSLHSELHGGLLAAGHFRMLHSMLPALQPLVLVLKELLRTHNLKSAFTGGLSSYALVVLVSRFLIDRHSFRYEQEGAKVDGEPRPATIESLGALFLECLHFLGSVFDPQNHAVYTGRLPQSSDAVVGANVLEYGFIWRDQCTELKEFALQPLLCADPVQPRNNVGKTCYRISCIQRLFRQTAAAAVRAAEQAAQRLGEGVVSDCASRVLAKMPISEAEVMKAIFSAHTDTVKSSPTPAHEGA